MIYLPTHPPLLHAPTCQGEGEGAAAYAEVELDLKKRTKQELAVPAVVHFYLWLLQVGGFCGAVRAELLRQGTVMHL